MSAGDKARFSRREVLQVAATSAAALRTVGLGLALARKGTDSRSELPRIRDHRVAHAPGSVEMAIIRGPDPAANVRKAVEALGGMSAFVRPGEKVLLKPNVGWNRLPEQAANTNPELVAEVARMVAAAGAAAVWVTDVPVNDHRQCFERSGIFRAAGAAGATVVLPERVGFREVDIGGTVLRNAEVLAKVLEADRIINLPVVKEHGISRATLSMKNWYGVLGGIRARLHQDLHRSVVDLAVAIKPTLTIMDATRVLMANGPTGGSPSDVKRMDTVAASTDQVALDAFGASLLGFTVGEVESILIGDRAGLGRSDFRALKLVEVAG
jgi:uncharacterized protein (DUF362 family)